MTPPTPEYVTAAETATREQNAGYITVMLEGRHTDAYLEQAGAGAPTLTEDELQTIGSPARLRGHQRLQAGLARRAVRPAAWVPGHPDQRLPLRHPAADPKLSAEWFREAARQNAVVEPARSPGTGEAGAPRPARHSG